MPAQASGFKIRQQETTKHRNKMKYTDYTPNRSADDIRADIAMIQSLRHDRNQNRRFKRDLPDWVFGLCQFLAIVGFVFCMIALFLEIFA